MMESASAESVFCGRCGGGDRVWKIASVKCVSRVARVLNISARKLRQRGCTLESAAGRLALWKSVSEKTMFEEAGLCKSFIGKADSERRWSTHWEEDKADTNRQDSVTGPKVCNKGGGVAIKF